jgi:hypothetical protein
VSDSKGEFRGTELRRRYARARRLDLDAQTAECIDYLGAPEVLVGEFVDAYCAVENYAGPMPAADEQQTKPPKNEDDELVLEHFYPERRIDVEGDTPAFKCLSSRLAPLGHTHDADDARRAGLDYLGVEANEKAAVLGVAESMHDGSVYLLLFRALACLAEIAPDAQRARLETRLGATLPWPPCYDLHLVTWERDPGATPLPLDTLAHDLAEAFMRGVSEEWLFPKVLRSISCLRMKPDEFDGRLTLAWSVKSEVVS